MKIDLKAICKAKNGFWALLLNPIVLGILAVVLLVFWLLSLFMLGKILGAAIIVFALIGWVKGIDPKWAVALVLLGIFVFWNPFDFAALQFIR